MGQESQYGDSCGQVRLVPISQILPEIMANSPIRDQAQLESLVPEVEKGVSGRRVMTEGEDDTGDES